MPAWMPPPRSAQTTIACRRCARPLVARRSCHRAYLHCEECRKDFELREYIGEMDRALESFLEAINCDRV